MRLKEMKIDPATMQLNVDIMGINNKVIVIGNGKAKIANLPEFGETKIITHQREVGRRRRILKWETIECTVKELNLEEQFHLMITKN
ncbi:XtrA/YqaO family protein [Sporolactobacillus shoreicorticis]|uniref:XtrA/YqaO family protein n=1 Tax=Sporolactobacillus shoreicorticis TaxID=1923877 RepID=A0ABW5S1K1_9BACL|nr:XtrA/YqaO family protein [Sporolactobacillus shoreicorticis]MCO7125008.1 XtrA/YqaO family protein [Sporolactobacillus shoreicorticis]